MPERDIIRALHVRGHGIVVIAHAPQVEGGCHPFEFLRGVFPSETDQDAFERVRPEILEYIFRKCGRSCQCNSGSPTIHYRIFGKN